MDIIGWAGIAQLDEIQADQEKSPVSNFRYS